MSYCISRKHRLFEDLYRCQYNLAGIYQRTGNLSQALRHVEVAIKCAVKMKDKLAERESLILKGKVRSEFHVTANWVLHVAPITVSYWMTSLGSASTSAENVALPAFTRHTHTHTHPFNGPLSGTTRVSRYQKGKTYLDFTGARDSEWQWHQLGHMQVCTSLQTDNHASTSLLSFLQAGCPSCRPTHSVKALKAMWCKHFHWNTRVVQFSSCAVNKVLG